MIQINSTSERNLIKICEDHFDGIQPKILAGIKMLGKRQKDFITNNLHDIVVSKPEDLFRLNKEFIVYCKNKAGRYPIKNPNKGLKKVFNYAWFTQTNAKHYCAYDLAKNLNYKTCPYCNRNYTVTVVEKGKRIVRPDFDHFFPKDKYPLLTLSFYNLIPSCPLCNRSVKGAATIVYGKYLHPYEEGYGTALKINYFPLDTDSAHGIKSNFKILTMLNPMESTKAIRCENNFKLFKLKEIYEESHCGEIADIVRKHIVSNGKYLEVLHKAFPKLGTFHELYKIAFGNYYDELHFEKRPLSKLTKDIVEQLVFSIPTSMP